MDGESPKSSLTKEKTEAEVLPLSKTPFSPLEKQTPGAFCFMFNLYHAVSKKIVFEKLKIKVRN